MGVFENPVLAGGTIALAKAVSESKALSVVGGGDSVAAIKQSGVAQECSIFSNSFLLANLPRTCT